MKRDVLSTVCIKICMLFYLLFGIFDSVSSEELKFKEKGVDKSSNNIVSDSMVFDQQVDSISVFAFGECVDSYENQTVSSVVLVQGCNALTVKNVIVSGNGDLTLSASDAVLINGSFEVKLGGLLNIKNELTQWSMDYGYDNAGNRIRRSANSMKLSDVD